MLGGAMSTPVALGKSEHVARALEREIRAGHVSHGDQLGSEGALMRRFSVSRNTVRRGLEILTRQGLITTRTGIGSFVTYDGTTIDSKNGWTVALSHGEGAVETRLLGISMGQSEFADRELGTVQDYLCIDRLRHCQRARQGISLERSRLPWRAEYTPILSDGLRDGSLNATLAAIGLFSFNGKEMASVIPSLTQVDADIMGRRAGTPMLRMVRVTRLADGSALEVVESILDPERFGLRIEF